MRPSTKRPRSSLALAAFVGACALAVAAGAGCDWRDFDHLKGETPVLAVGPPGSFNSKDDFGRHLLALAGPATGATGGRFIVSAANDAELGIMAVDAKGALTGHGYSAPTFGDQAPTPAITSMAEIFGKEQILLGAPEANGEVGNVYVLTLGANLTSVLFDSPDGEDRFGLGVAVGALGGGADPDYVVASGTSLYVYLDGQPASRVQAAEPPAACPLVLTKDLPSVDRANRAVLVAPLMEGGGSQIVVGTPSMTDAGAVSVFGVDATSGAATCLFALRNPAPRFGHSLATGDFNHDGKLDLLVGAPPTGAFWIAGPLSATSAVLPVTLADAHTTGELGFAVAAANLDGAPGDEALVSDFEASVDGADAAGEVYVSSGSALDTPLPPIRRASVGAADKLGSALAPLPFCTSNCGAASAVTTTLPLVGAAKQTFVFFRATPGAADPRTH